MSAASPEVTAAPEVSMVSAALVGKAALVLALPAILWALGYLKPEEKHKIKGLAIDARRAVTRRFGGSRS